MSPFEGSSYPETDFSEATTPVTEDGDRVLDLSNWTFERPSEFQDSLTKVSTMCRLLLALVLHCFVAIPVGFTVRV